MKNLLLTATKSVDLDQYPEEAWTHLSGTNDPAAAYFRAVPWLYRGVTIRAQAVSSMPFAIYRDKAEFDASANWKNKVGFLPNPRRLFWLLEACLTLSPAAYLFSDNLGRTRKLLRYIIPSSVTPVIDPLAGLTVFKRTVSGEMREFAPGMDIVYFWQPDPTVEQGAGPGKSSPARAALAAAGVLANIDEFISGYFAHGAVKATVLGVKGAPSRQEVEKLESWWKQFVGGVKNAWGGKVINSDAITPTVIGEGLESLGNNTLTNERREDIATALGVPHSLLFSNASNFATAQQDDLHFYNKTIVPECELIADTLNEQVFGPLGLRLAFQPETLDAFQEDTQQQAAALAQLTGAGIPLLMAADLVGIELTDEQRSELEKAQVEKEQRAKEGQEQLRGGGQPAAPSGNDAPQETPAGADARRWMTKAVKAVKRGEAASVPFESDAIPESEQRRIRAGLAAAVTVDDVRAVFDAPVEVDPLVLLVGELRRANDLLEREVTGDGAG